MYDELEKNATEKKAKEVTDSFTALKKETDDAKKKLDADKKGLTTKEAELKKSDAALVLAEKESAKLALLSLKKAAEAKLTKARDDPEEARGKRVARCEAKLAASEEISGRCREIGRLAQGKITSPDPGQGCARKRKERKN